MTRKRNRILIECTHTLHTDLNTGIQRVVRNIIRHARRLQRQLNVECVPVIIRDGDFLDARDTWHPASLGRLADRLESLNHTAALRYGNRPVRDRLWKLLYPRTPMRKLARKVRRLADRRIEFSQRDTLLMLDASWNLPAWPAVQEAKQNGCRVCCVSYDLIPLTTPQFCVPELVQGFLNWLSQAVHHVDFFIAISQHVSRELETYIRSAFPDVELPTSRFESFRLGADFSRRARGRIRPQIRELLSPGSGSAPYLTVGTIAPHKNHRFLLDAFDLVRTSAPQTRLLLVGKSGWMCDDLMRRITEHPAFGSSLFLFNDLSDAELCQCYQRCRALLAPSLVEGFGLPLVEALQFGLPVLASNTPIHREVGREDCAYFDLEDPANLATMIRDIELDGKFPAVRRPGKYKPTTWRDSCRELLTKTVRMSQELSAGDSALMEGAATSATPRRQAA